MKPMSLNLSGMKKVKEDEHSAAFMHPKGHTITIAKAKLPAAHKKQIEALPLCNGGAVNMADGGTVSDIVPSQLLEQNRTPFFEGPDLSNLDPNAPMPMIPAQLRGQAQAAAPSRAEMPAPDLSGLDPNAPMPPIPGQLRPPGMTGQGYDLSPVNLPSVGDAASWLMQRADGGQGVAPQSAAGSPAHETSSQPSNVHLGAPPPGMQLPGMGQGYDPYGGYRTQMAGVQNEAKAIGALEAEKARIYEHNQNTLKNIHQNFEQNYLTNQAETSDMIADMKNSHIDPKAYINNMSTGQHVSTAIGLLLGGMGGGVLGTGGNVAMDFLNKQIDRDVDAQKSNIENKKTVFNAMQHQYQNQTDATNMTKAFYLAKTANEINIAAAKAGTPLAAARAQQMIGPIQNQLHQIHMEVAMRQAAFNALKNGGSAAAAIPYLVHDKSKVEDAAKAYGSLEQLAAQEKNVVNSFNQIRNKTLNGLFSPNDTASAKQAFIGNLQVALEHRYNSDAAAALGNAIFPKATDAQSTVDNKLKRLHEEFDGSRREHQAILSGLTSGLMQGPAAPPRANMRQQKR